MFSSTATGPLEVFRHTGTLWGLLTGGPQLPRFRVTTASADGRSVPCEGGVSIKSDMALSEVRSADLIFVPTSGMSPADIERNLRIAPWIKRWHERGAAIA